MKLRLFLVCLLLAVFVSCEKSSVEVNSTDETQQSDIVIADLKLNDHSQGPISLLEDSMLLIAIRNWSVNRSRTNWIPQHRLQVNIDHILDWTKGNRTTLDYGESLEYAGKTLVRRIAPDGSIFYSSNAHGGGSIYDDIDHTFTNDFYNLTYKNDGDMESGSIEIPLALKSFIANRTDIINADEINDYTTKDTTNLEDTDLTIEFNKKINTNISYVNFGVTYWDGSTIAGSTVNIILEKDREINFFKVLRKDLKNMNIKLLEELKKALIRRYPDRFNSNSILDPSHISYALYLRKFHVYEVKDQQVTDKQGKKYNVLMEFSDFFDLILDKKFNLSNL